jgi:hypothetical protein
MFGDKAESSAVDGATMLGETKGRLIRVWRANMHPHAWSLDEIELHDYQHTIETVTSQCEKMGLERVYARTNPRFELKVLASMIALLCTNMNEQSRYRC